MNSAPAPLSAPTGSSARHAGAGWLLLGVFVAALLAQGATLSILVSCV